MTTLTIRQVSDDVADALRRRAEANRRSLQRELLLIIERAASEGLLVSAVAEPTTAYASEREAKAPVAGAPRTRRGRLTLEELWQRARALGAAMPVESTAIVRRDRDARNRP